MTIYCKRCFEVNTSIEEATQVCLVCKCKTDFGIVPDAVYHQVRRQFENDWKVILSTMTFDYLMGCWMVPYHGMAMGIEIDGYCHS